MKKSKISPPARLFKNDLTLSQEKFPTFAPNICPRIECSGDERPGITDKYDQFSNTPLEVVPSVTTAIPPGNLTAEFGWEAIYRVQGKGRAHVRIVTVWGTVQAFCNCRIQVPQVAGKTMKAADPSPGRLPAIKFYVTFNCKICCLISLPVTSLSLG